MNIAFVFEAPIIPRRGGVQRVTDIISGEFVKRGHNVIFLTYGYKELISDDTISCPQYYIELKGRSRIEIQEDLKSQFEYKQIDILINQQVTRESYILNQIFKDFSKVISVWHTRPYPDDEIDRARISQLHPENLKHAIFLAVSWAFPKFYRAYFANVETRLFLLADNSSHKICLLSESYRHRVCRHVESISQKKFSYISNPNTYTVVSDMSWTQKQNTVLWVGRINNVNKNTIDFIKFWERFSKSRPNWNSIILGDGPDLEANKKYVQFHNIKNLVFAGSVKDIQDYYRMSKILVQTSWSEGWPMVINEARSFGCVPVVYGTYEALDELIIDGKDGIVVNPSVSDLCETVFKLTENEIELQQIANHGIGTMDRYDVKYIVDQWIELIDSITDEK